MRDYVKTLSNHTDRILFSYTIDGIVGLGDRDLIVRLNLNEKNTHAL